MFVEARTRLVVGALGVIIVALAVGLGLAVAMGDDGHMMPGGSGYPGMMRAMGMMDRDGMLQHMKEVLGDDGYARMLQHMQDHRGGAMSSNAQMDQTMHMMMDGMMGQMGLIPTPSSTATPTK